MASTIARVAYTGWMDVLSRLLCRLRTTWLHAGILFSIRLRLSTSASTSTTYRPIPNAPTQILAALYNQRTNTSPAFRHSSIIHKKTAQLRVSPAPTSSPASSCSSAQSAQTMCALPPAVAEGGTTFWTKVVGIDTVRASIACYSLCCTETGGKSCKPRQDGGSLSFLLSFGLCVGN